MLKDRIKEERNKRKISQQKLADSIGVSQQTIGSWETGRTEPDQSSIMKLCTYFGISPNSLLGIDTSQTSDTELSPKEKKDIAKDLEKFKKELLESDELMFDGHPISEDSINNILAALEIGMEQVRRKNRIKYNPKKFKNK